MYLQSKLILFRLDNSVGTAFKDRLHQYALRDNMDNMNAQEELIKLKEESGLGWKKFSDYYGIPYRTVQDWYMGKRRMPEYLLRLMIYKAETEKLFKEYNKGGDSA